MPDSETPPAESRRGDGPLAHGVAVIRGYLRTLPQAPGVYRMLGESGAVLYVGKAKCLKRRVANYTQPARQPLRIQRMIAETATMEFVITNSEVEALLLEGNLIKRLLPRYNVLLRDDKSFPHILIAGDHPHPQLTKHRGARNRPGDYFGPFASAGAVNRTVAALQRGFMLRTCTDTVFAGRSRPCLQYQIKRCTAPCVGRVTVAEYAAQVGQARAFLSGRSRDIQAGYAESMLAASEALDFETAAQYRDRIRALTAIQAHQDINFQDIDDADVVAAHQEGGQTCVQLFFFRGGCNYGTHAYFPSHERGLAVEEVLASFLVQFYENKPAPPLVLLSHEPPERTLIAEALTLHTGRRVDLAVPARGEKRRAVEHALTNAREALGRRQAERASQTRLLAGVAGLFALARPPGRIEVYDNSHIQGTNCIGAMIVAGPEGFTRNAYRKFTIRNDGVMGNDYGMMREVLGRRFARALKEDPGRQSGSWPDLVLIDGGQGQLNVALDVLAALGIADLAVAAIAKGPERNAGRERFFMAGREPFSPEPRDPVLYYLQRLRDEAHRFAIGTHRDRRIKAQTRSEIDQVPGIGPARKKALLLHFGSARAVARAGLADLEAVPGVNTTVARKIYEFFHAEG
ncbi:MAG: excinuclease ABC subunit UvrC [Rhodospirillaceae bacterium]